jgi:threonine dehydrogenase-like Zn-dependent dehydrogenase/predicted NBD/HSP70 family sugar kinase
VPAAERPAGGGAAAGLVLADAEAGAVIGRLVAVDVGGTSTRIAVVEDGVLAGPPRRLSTPSPRRDPSLSAPDAAAALLDRLALEIGRLRQEHPDLRTVVLAFGAVIGLDGVVRNASTLWLTPASGFDVRGGLASRLPWAEVIVLNDVTAAAWNYRGLGRFALATVSTGVALKVFDATASTDSGLLLDPEGLGGESGHTLLDGSLLLRVRGGPIRARELGRAAAAGDASARAELDEADLPWCECGAVADLCSFASGPAAARAATRFAVREPHAFAASLLARIVGGEASRIDTAALAEAARNGDPFTGSVLAASVRPLAVRLLTLAADLGLRRAVVVGGFAHGVGAPWFAALRAALAELVVDAGWFTGWTERDLESFVHVPDDDQTCVLTGAAAYATAAAGRVRHALKPVGVGALELRTGPRPRIGREQFLIEVEYAGVCRTDLEILRGERGCEPGVPGHECVGVVVEAGDGLGGRLAPGQRVALNPNRPGEDHGKLGHDEPGVFGTAYVGDLGLLARGQVLVLPGPPRPEWVLLELLGGVIRAQRMLDELAGRTLVVVGAGIAGLLHAMLARSAGARVLITNRGPARLADAVERGVVLPGETVAWGPALRAEVLDRTDGHGADAAVIAVAGDGGPAALGELWPALAPKSAVHLFGGFSGAAGAAVRLPGGAVLDAAAVRAGAESRRVVAPSGAHTTVHGSRGAARRDLEQARDLVCRPAPALDLAPLVSHLISLDALPEVIGELAERGTVGGEFARRVVIDPRRPGRLITRSLR